MVALLVLVGACGCSTPHTIVLNDGSKIQTRNEPKYVRKSGFYEYKDASGREAQVNKDQVQMIERRR